MGQGWSSAPSLCHFVLPYTGLLLPLSTLSSSPQVGVFSHSEACDGRSVLPQFLCPGALLFNQGVGSEEGARLHKLCGGVSSGWRGAGTSMPAGGHHQDGVQGDTLDIPLRRCEFMQYQQLLGHWYPCHHLLHAHLLNFLFHRFSLSGQRWKQEESPSVNPEGNTLGREF